MEQVRNQRSKQLAVSIAEAAVAQPVQYFAQQRIPIIDLVWAIAVGLHLLDLFRRQPKEEEVLFPNFLPNLDIRAIHRANGESAVHLHLHAPSTRSFLAS